MDKSAIPEKVRDLPTAIEEFIAKNLDRPDYRAAINELERILPIAKALVESYYEGIAPPKTRGLTGAADAIISATKQEGYLLATNKAHVDELLNNSQKYENLAIPVICYSFAAHRRPHIERTDSELRKLQENGRALVKELEDLRNKQREVLADKTVAKHAEFFETDTKEHRRDAGRWLVALIALGGVTIFFGWTFFDALHVDSPTIPQVIRFFLVRIIILSVLSFGLAFCARNYSAARHNTVVNQHRANALNSFEAFLASAADPQTKDAVLLQATQSIFLPQASGYGKAADAPAVSPSIIEILKEARKAE